MTMCQKIRTAIWQAALFTGVWYLMDRYYYADESPIAFYVSIAIAFLVGKLYP